ncbi:hypothetical protein FAP39_01870 [Shimia litoralis]|uniref:Uncharacterized protein n=1 Tax=Shimia litoralis TaxID=420403 RepID=A0A4V6F2F4_9RHOB|nr:hypothetical protein [Shimia litoralis]TKZ22641.1 hypothetical protein FAP39_01870 [Shimia litoralis]
MRGEDETGLAVLVFVRVQRADWSCGCCELTNLSDDWDLLNLMTDQNIPKRRQRLIEDMLIKGL